MNFVSQIEWIVIAGGSIGKPAQSANQLVLYVAFSVCADFGEH